jgi:hypothetical protein
VHLIEVGDGKPGAAETAKPEVTDATVKVRLNGKTCVFSRRAPFEVSVQK